MLEYEESMFGDTDENCHLEKAHLSIITAKQVSSKLTSHKGNVRECDKLKFRREFEKIHSTRSHTKPKYFVRLSMLDDVNVPKQSLY